MTTDLITHRINALELRVSNLEHGVCPDVDANVIMSQQKIPTFSEKASVFSSYKPDRIEEATPLDMHLMQRAEADLAVITQLNATIKRLSLEHTRYEARVTALKLEMTNRYKEMEMMYTCVSKSSYTTKFIDPIFNGNGQVKMKVSL